MSARAVLIALSAVHATAGCVASAPTTAAPAPAPTPLATTPGLLPLPPDAECTLETPLVPGVPGSPGHLIASTIHPAGASELATLMRVMLDDVDRRRQQLLGATDGARVPMHDVHRRMRCAWTTEGHARDAAFDAFAQAYLGAVRRLDAAPEDPAAFDAVVTGCRLCHEQKCRGPIGRIEKLRLTASATTTAAR